MKYSDLIKAKELLGLPEQASFPEIKASYRKLLHRWHPDTCCGDKEECSEMTRKINAAYKIVLAYCNQYKYSFAEEDIKLEDAKDDWWEERFGNDPLWGKY